MSRERARRSAGSRTAAGSAGPLSAKDRRNFEKARDDTHALRQRAAKGAGPAMKKLMGMTIEDEQNLCTSLDGYKQLAAMRRAAYREQVRRMKIDPAIAALIGELARRFGPKVKVWNNVVDWTVAVLIGRYGEAPEHWPSELGADDERRLRNLLEQKQPMFEGVKTLGVDFNPREARFATVAADPTRPEGVELYLGIDDPDDSDTVEG